MFEHCICASLPQAASQGKLDSLESLFPWIQCIQLTDMLGCHQWRYCVVDAYHDLPDTACLPAVGMKQAIKIQETLLSSKTLRMTLGSY